MVQRKRRDRNGCWENAETRLSEKKNNVNTTKRYFFAHFKKSKKIGEKKKNKISRKPFVAMVFEDSSSPNSSMYYDNCLTIILSQT